MKLAKTFHYFAHGPETKRMVTPFIGDFHNNSELWKDWCKEKVAKCPQRHGCNFLFTDKKEIWVGHIHSQQELMHYWRSADPTVNILRDVLYLVNSNGVLLLHTADLSMLGSGCYMVFVQKDGKVGRM